MVDMALDTSPSFGRSFPFHRGHGCLRVCVCVHAPQDAHPLRVSSWRTLLTLPGSAPHTLPCVMSGNQLRRWPASSLAGGLPSRHLPRSPLCTVAPCAHMFLIGCAHRQIPVCSMSCSWGNCLCPILGWDACSSCPAPPLAWCTAFGEWDARMGWWWWWRRW